MTIYRKKAGIADEPEKSAKVILVLFVLVRIQAG
jgi:hypothetical protein